MLRNFQVPGIAFALSHFAALCGLSYRDVKGAESNMKLAIFGAKSIALGICLAVQKLYKEFEIKGFLVSSMEGNPDTLVGLPVCELGEYPCKKVCILIATPEDVQEEIVRLLEEQGFHNHICMDSREESRLMEKYYASIGDFPSIHDV